MSTGKKNNEDGGENRTPVCDLIQTLLSAGQAIEVALIAARALEVEIATGRARDLAALYKRRDWDRDRKRKSRGSAPTCPPDSRIPPLTSSTSLENKNGDKEGRREERDLLGRPPDKPKKPTATAMPADWAPKTKHYDRGRGLGLDRTAVDAEAEAAREWAGANAHLAKARKADWDLFFMSWLRRAKPGRGGGSRPTSPQPSPTGGPRGTGFGGRTSFADIALGRRGEGNE